MLKCLEIFSLLFAMLAWWAMPKRRRITLSNLAHAFPGRPRAWYRAMAKRSLRQSVETGLFSAALGMLPIKTLQKRFTLNLNGNEAALAQLQAQGQAALVLTPHLALMEAVTLFPLLYKAYIKEKGEGADAEFPPMKVLYRPLNIRWLERWVRSSRARFGVQPLSRKGGLLALKRALKSEGAWASVLFDQNAGDPGVTSAFLGRLCKSTPLPDMLHSYSGAPVYLAYIQRTGFWQGTLEVERLAVNKAHTQKSETAAYPVLRAANTWLEAYLKRSESHCARWLWAHARWKAFDRPTKRFAPPSVSKNALSQTMQWNVAEAGPSASTHPRGTQLVARMPNWLGDCVMALPVLRAIKASRPELHLTLLAPAAYVGWLEATGVANAVVALPAKKGAIYYAAAGKLLKYTYPSMHLCFTNSARGDMEAAVIGAPQRFGLLRPGKKGFLKRRLLTHVWQVPETFNLTTTHQTHLWKCMAQHFGLPAEIPLNTTPIRLTYPETEPENTPNVLNIKDNPHNTPILKIGLVCGTQNLPAKRWPISSWVQLAQGLLAHSGSIQLYLYGTPADRALTTQIQQGIQAEGRVHNVAGQTNLLGFCQSLQNCAHVVCNDTGGMHLANSLGVPITALFGPTNPVRTGPIFSGPVNIVQPPGCPATGGVPMEALSPAQVLERVKGVL